VCIIIIIVVVGYVGDRKANKMVYKLLVVPPPPPPPPPKVQFSLTSYYIHHVQKKLKHDNMAAEERFKKFCASLSYGVLLLGLRFMLWALPTNSCYRSLKIA